MEDECERGQALVDEIRKQDAFQLKKLAGRDVNRM